MTIEPEALAPDVLADDEPKYLRRQKPVEIRRRRFGRRSWQNFRRWAVIVPGTLVGAAALYVVGDFLLFSPRVVLAHPDQIVVMGNHYLSRGAILEKFYSDRGHSVLRVPLAKRREAIEALPWVQEATVQRLLPNRIRVEVTERTPVAFLRLANDLALVDVHGVILDRPQDGDFQFPVVAGIAESMPREQRDQRMQLFAQFMKEIDVAKPGSADHVSEVDLSEAKDLRATLTGVGSLAGANVPDSETALVHFGESDFGGKMRILADNFVQWRASTGRVDSIDLRFRQQVVVNPESNTTAARSARSDSAKTR
jgi:cell division protein FtsQ